VLNGIWYILWTGCQWKAVHRDWFGVSSSVLHERFQTWQEVGVWDKVFQTLVKFYRRERRIQWRWQAVDSRSCAAPLGGSKTGKNPTDRAKLGSKIHILVDQRGAPLAIDISGANQHDKWSVKNLVFHVAVKRPGSEQHFCGDKGYDFDDVRHIVAQAGYVAHIKRKCVSSWNLSPGGENVIIRNEPTLSNSGTIGLCPGRHRRRGDDQGGRCGSHPASSFSGWIEYSRDQSAVASRATGDPAGAGECGAGAVSAGASPASAGVGCVEGAHRRVVD
jgi:transposase